MCKLCAQGIPGHEGAIGAIGQQRQKGSAISPRIGVLLAQEIEPLLDDSADRGKSTTIDEAFCEGVLVIAQGDGAFDRHGILRRSSMTR
jgi:hypothetical protein